MDDLEERLRCGQVLSRGVEIVGEVFPCNTGEEAADRLRQYREACVAYCKAFDEGSGTVYVEPIIRKALSHTKGDE